MKLKIFIAMLSIAAMSNSYAFGVMGKRNCGTWVKDRQSSTPNNLSLQAIVLETWLVGFVSGLNADERKNNFLSKTSADQIYLWMDNYCKANPLDDLVDGSLKLSIELMNKK